MTDVDVYEMVLKRPLSWIPYISELRWKSDGRAGRLQVKQEQKISLEW